MASILCIIVVFFRSLSLARCATHISHRPVAVCGDAIVVAAAYDCISMAQFLGCLYILRHND